MTTPPELFDTGLAPDALDPARPVPFDTPWGPYSLFSVPAGVVAAQSFCPHLLGPLFQGTLSGNEITCPWHRWRFSLESGECVAAPDDADASGTRIHFLGVSIGAGGTYVLRGPGVLRDQAGEPVESGDPAEGEPGPGPG